VLNSASATQPYLLLLEPGVYDLGTRQVVIDDFVSVRGSGQESTVIQSARRSSNSSAAGVIEFNSGSEISDLTVRNQTPAGVSAPFSVGIYLNSSDRLIVRRATVDVDASTAGNFIFPEGITADRDAELVVEDSTVRVTGASAGVGVPAAISHTSSTDPATATLEVRRSNLSATGGLLPTGVDVHGATFSIEHSRLDAATAVALAPVGSTIGTLAHSIILGVTDAGSGSLTCLANTSASADLGTTCPT